jgi:hypothetical protein
MHENGKALAGELVRQRAAFEQTMHRHFLPGGGLQTAERRDHSLGAADLHTVDYVSDSHVQA